MKRLLIATAIAVAAFAASATAASAATIYSATTSTTTAGNGPAFNFETGQASEFGDEIVVPSDDPDGYIPTTVKVQLDSSACQEGTATGAYCYSAAGATFSVPLTLTLYAANSSNPNVPGPTIDSFTQTVTVPYRPSSNPSKCHGANAGQFYLGSAGSCLTAKPFTATFKIGGNGIQLSAGTSVILSVAYDTSDYGYNPIGDDPSCYGVVGPFGTVAGCPYDNIGVVLSPSVTTGTETNPGTVWLNAANSSDYCDATPTPGKFNLDSPTSSCFTGEVPAIQLSANAAP